MVAVIEGTAKWTAPYLFHAIRWALGHGTCRHTRGGCAGMLYKYRKYFTRRALTDSYTPLERYTYRSVSDCSCKHEECIAPNSLRKQKHHGIVNSTSKHLLSRQWRRNPPLRASAAQKPPNVECSPSFASSDSSWQLCLSSAHTTATLSM